MSTIKTNYGRKTIKQKQAFEIVIKYCNIILSFYIEKAEKTTCHRYY